MAELIISISGMRGIVGENLTGAIACEYGAAFGTFLKSKTAEKISVAIGQDSRPSGNMIKAAVSAGLCSVGVDVVDLGIVTTPCVGIMLRELGCAGGVVITASHNPLPFNGIKLLLGNGIAPDPATAEAIKKIYFDKSFGYVTSPQCGKIKADDRTGKVHIDKVLAIIDKNKIAAKKIKIALDCVNGAGGPVTKELLGILGCEVVAINDEPTGMFAHTPEPTAENIIDLRQLVVRAGADIGFAQDPDADRLAIVDEKGNYIGEEYTLALAAKFIYNSMKGPAAANLSTSRMIDDVAGGAGAKVVRTPVGEANVAKAMIENKCVIGGEGNGGIIDLRVGPVRDSLVGIGLVLQLMADTGKKVSELVGEIPSYYMKKDKLEADKTLAGKICEGAKAVFTDARLDTADGYRFDFADGWVHLRTSNTEPVMRIIVEATDKAAAERYIGKVNEIRRSVVSGQ